MHGRSKALPPIERVTITVEMATNLLEMNGLNRPLKQNHVQRIATQIAEGKWQFNGDTIKIADTGDVLDGQHRLWAVIEAKRPIDTYIVRGVPKEAFATIDTLRAPRSGGDVVALAGVARHRNLVASALAWLLRYQRKTLLNYRDPQNRIENSDIEVALADNPGIVKAVERAASLRGVANPAITGFFAYILAMRDVEIAERMLYTLRDPSGIPITDPFFLLRSYFLARNGGTKDPIVSIALCIKAANAAKNGERMKVLRWVQSGDHPEPFPVLTVTGTVTPI